MLLSEFMECVDKIAFFDINEYTYYTDDKELVNNKNGKTKSFDSVEQLLLFEIDGTLVRDYIELPSFKLLVDLKGGRGSSSSGTFRFGHDSRNRGDGEQQVRFPAEFNTGDRYQSFESALQRFRERHATSHIEYGIAVDENGYVHRYIQGGPSSVAISGRDGQMIIHNHPGGGAFSDSDLLSSSQVKGERGIVASGRYGDYIFRKRKNFNATGFAKAVRNARMRGTDYNDAVDRWLTANQKKYGYTYEFRRV